MLWAPEAEIPPSHFSREVTVGAGLPPLAGQRTEVTLETARSGDAEAGDGADTLPLRLVTGGRIRAAGRAAAGAFAILPIGPFAEGDVTGRVETDPDALGADDRRCFSFAVRPAVAVQRQGEG